MEKSGNEICCLEVTMKAVIYARFSSHNQREESIDGQIRECKEFAKKNQIEIVRTYIDRAMSAKTDNRPDFQRMIRDSAARQWDAVIVYELDRFARNRYDSANYKAKLKHNGVKVMSAKENITDDPTGIILESMLEGMAEYYSAELAQKINRGMEQNVLEAKWTGGNLPLGYRISADKHFEVDPLSAQAVKSIFADYAAGKSIKKIVDELNQQGLRTTRGNIFGPNSLDRILRNQKYIGVYKYHGITSPSGIPAIVSKELFYEVQTMLKKNKAAPARKKANTDYLLTGKIFCGECKSNMIGECGRSRNGETHYYYKCANHKRARGCKLPAIKKDWIESEIVKQTVNEVLTDQMIDYISENAVKMQRKENELNILSELEKQVSEKKKAIENLVKAIESGACSPAISERITALEEEKAGIESEIAIEKIQKPEISADQVRYYLENFRQGDIHNPDYCQRIIDIFVRAVYVYADRYCITYRYSGKSESKEPKGSDLDCYAPPKHDYPNILFTPEWFGVIVSYNRGHRH